MGSPEWQQCLPNNIHTSRWRWGQTNNPLFRYPRDSFILVLVWKFWLWWDCDTSPSRNRSQESEVGGDHMEKAWKTELRLVSVRHGDLLSASDCHSFCPHCQLWRSDMVFRLARRLWTCGEAFLSLLRLSFQSFQEPFPPLSFCVSWGRIALRRPVFSEDK